MNLTPYKVRVIKYIKEYDSSSEVNSFYINGKQLWLDKATRVGLVNSTNALISQGITDTTLWYNGLSFTMPCATLLDLLNKLEVYALNCYNVTEQHKNAVNALTLRSEILQYDYKSGYPEKLNITLS